VIWVCLYYLSLYTNVRRDDSSYIVDLLKILKLLVQCSERASIIWPMCLWSNSLLPADQLSKSSCYIRYARAVVGSKKKRAVHWLYCNLKFTSSTKNGYVVVTNCCWRLQVRLYLRTNDKREGKQLFCQLWVNLLWLTASFSEVGGHFLTTYQR